MIRIISFIIFLLVSFASVQSFSDDVVYLNEIGGIPLMPQASIVNGSGMVFDKPSGRIANVTIATALTVKDVFNYYIQTLPALGWISDNGSAGKGILSFTRKREKLMFEVEESNKLTAISISLYPLE